MAALELYGSASCQHTGELRDWLELRGADYAEYDVDTDAEARVRVQALTGGRVVPVLVQDGTVVQVGWQGRGCAFGE